MKKEFFCQKNVGNVIVVSLLWSFACVRVIIGDARRAKRISAIHIEKFNNMVFGKFPSFLGAEI